MVAGPGRNTVYLYAGCGQSIPDTANGTAITRRDSGGPRDEQKFIHTHGMNLYRQQDPILYNTNYNM